MLASMPWCSHCLVCEQRCLGNCTFTRRSGGLRNTRPPWPFTGENTAQELLCLLEGTLSKDSKAEILRRQLEEFQTDWITHFFSEDQIHDFQSSVFFVSSTLIDLHGELYEVWIKYTNYTSLRFINAFYHKRLWDVGSFGERNSARGHTSQVSPQKPWVREQQCLYWSRQEGHVKCSKFLNLVLAYFMEKTICVLRKKCLSSHLSSHNTCFWKIVSLSVFFLLHWTLIVTPTKVYIS